MKIRLVGTKAEVTEAAALLTDVFDVQEVSDTRPRRNGTLVTVYVEAALLESVQGQL